jgi:hypothetical protein
MKFLNEIADRLCLIGVYMAYIGGLSWIGSRIMDVDYNEMIVPTLLGVFIIETVNTRMKFRNVKGVPVDLSKLEKKFEDKLQFEINSRVIGDNLSSIKAGNVSLDVIDNTYKIKLLEREIEKLKEVKQ